MGFALAAGSASVQGTVSETNGVALPTATVCARQTADSSGQDSTATPRCTMVSVDGRYAIIDLPLGRYTVSATAPGHLPTIHSFAGANALGETEEIALAAGDVVSDVDLALAVGGARIFGRVVDEHGGKIAGALVTASTHGADFVVTSDEEGSFVADVGTGNVALVAKYPGYADAAVDAVAPTSLQITMGSETVLAGIVVDATTQRPIAAARVRPEGGDDGAWAVNQQTVLTDETGHFRIDGLPPGRYRPAAEAIGEKGDLPSSIVLGQGESAGDLVIMLSPAHHVEGRLLLDGKSVCRDGWVSLSERQSYKSDWRRVDAAGTVLFPAIDDGSYQISLECDGIESSPDAPLVIDRDLDNVAWSVARGLAIKGFVLDADGKPIARANVRAAVSEGASEASSNAVYTSSASDGSFSLAGLHATTYHLTADSDDHASNEKPLSITLGARDVEGIRLSMLRGGIVEGVVVDSAGVPIENARLQSTGNATHLATSDATGRFRFTGLPPGKVTIVANSELGRPMPISKLERELEVIDGQTITTRLVVRRPEGLLRGRVIDDEGKPVVGAFVDADSSEFGARITNLSSERSVNTDAQGRFVIAGLDEGAHSIRARAGQKEALLVGVALGSDVTLTLRKGTRVEGTVAFENGNAPTRFTVSLTSGGLDLREDFIGTNGHFVFQAVPAGASLEAVISVVAPQGVGDTSTPLTGDGTAHVAVVLSLFRTVTGRIVGVDGQPVAHAAVSVDASSAYANTDQAGRFVLENVHGAKLEAEVSSDEAPFAHISLSRAIDASSSASIDLGDIVLKPEESEASSDGAEGTEAPLGEGDEPHGGMDK